MKCQEVGYIFGEKSNYEVDNSTILDANETDLIHFTAAGEGAITYDPNETYGDIKKIFIQKVEVGKTYQKTKTILSSNSGGPRTIDQTCDIYYHLINNWMYVEGPKNETYDSLGNATEILGLDRKNYTGKYKGNCNEFAIGMASMLESIGITARIILARGPESSHAYAEAYIGNMLENEKRVIQVINWLKKKYHKKEITTTKNLSSGDVWLNLDWGEGYNSKPDCPGASPLFLAKDPIIGYPCRPPKSTLNPTPLSLFKISPYGKPINASENIEFDASDCTEVDSIKDYNWDFGDNRGDISHKQGSELRMVNHSYLHSGNYTISLIVTDEDNQTNSSSAVIIISGERAPLKPTIESFSADPESIYPGSSSNLSWTTRDASNVTLSQDIENEVEDIALNGTHRVSPNVTTRYLLRASNCNGSDEKTIRIFVEQKRRPTAQPEGIFSYNPLQPREGDVVTFDSSQSVSKGSDISYYEWNFGDGNISTNKVSKHAFSKYGNYTVVLTVIAEDGQRNYALKQISVLPFQSAELKVDSFTFTPNPVCAGHTTMMNWVASHATGVTITPGIGSLEPSGSMVVSPTQSMGYTIQAWNSSAHTKPKTVFLELQQCEPNHNSASSTGLYKRVIKGYVKYVGGNIVRIGVDVKLQEIFNGHVFDIGSTVSSRGDGSFTITYNTDSLNNPYNPYLIIQAFFHGKPFSDPAENVGNLERVDLICITSISGSTSWL